VKSTDCKLFPKILGGTAGHTYLSQIDVFNNEYLLMAGSTYDHTLTGLTSNSSFVPYLALSSIETSGKFYWAKALTLKVNTRLNGAQFSYDGGLIIAHSSS